MFERRHDQLLPRREFLRRVIRSLGAGLALIALSLGLGMTGYHYIAHVSWIDAFLDAAMILSGMGPVSELHTTGAKLFAGLYALYCGIALLTTAGVILAPVLHRVQHKFHLEDDSRD